MTWPSLAFALDVFFDAFLRRFFAIVGSLSVVLVDERLFFDVELLVAVVLVLLRDKVSIVFTFFLVTLEAT